MDKKDENKTEEIYGEGDPILENFREMVAKIFFRGLLIIFILATIGGFYTGEYKTNMIPYIAIKGAIYVLMNLLIIQRFKKHTMWILIWISILLFISVFLYPHEQITL